jgi:hypothetical protein
MGEAVFGQLSMQRSQRQTELQRYFVCRWKSCLVMEHAKSIMPDLDMDEVHFGQLITLALGLFLVGLGRVIYGLSLLISAQPM